MAQADFDTYWSEFDHAEHEELSRSRCWVCDEADCDCTPADHDAAEQALREQILRRRREALEAEQGFDVPRAPEAQP